MSRLVLVLGIAFVSSAVPAWGDTPEGAVRGFLALAYDGRFDALPKTPDARTERFERQVRNVLRVRCIHADRIAVSVVREGPDLVTLHADVAMAKRDPKGAGAWSAVEIVPLRFELARQGDRWLVAEVRNRDDEHAERFQQASAEERERLWREQPELLSKGLARALYARSLAQLNTGGFKEGADAAALARRVAIEAGDRGGEALALGAASLAAKGTGSDDLSKEALAIAETTGDQEVLARAWYDRGRASAITSRTIRTADPAECYRKAILLAERAEDPAILMRALYSLANMAANQQSDFLSARRFIDEGIAVAREVGDLIGEMGFEMVLSTVYFEQGDVERGLVHHALATDLAEKTQAWAYPSLLVRGGCLLVNHGRYDEALATFDRVVARTETGMIARFKSLPGRHMGSALRAMAVIEAHRGNFSEARCLHREAAAHDTGNADSYVYELAPHYVSHGNDAGALASSLASLAQNILHAPEQVDALLSAARAYRSMGLADRGLETTLEAIEIREALDEKIAGDERQHAIAASATSECYELAAEFTLAGGDPVGALVFLERGRARVLTDLLENGRPGSGAELDAEVREQQAVLDGEVARIGMELDRAQLAGGKTIADQQERLNRARAVRASFVDGVRARSERQNAVRRRIDAGEVAALVGRLPARTVAIEYFAGEDHLYIFVLGGALGDKGVSVRTKRVERKVLDERVNVFLERLTNNDLRVQALGRELYSLLVEPIEKDIAGADVLLVVPDDSLWGVPFAALVDGRGRFLVESRAIFYAPSMMAWSSITDARKRSASPRGSLLAIGNPTLDPAAGKAAASFYRNATLGPLPDAETEVDALSALYDPRLSLVLKRQDATEARTKLALRHADVAHFATHAILDDANPMYSRLMLARDGRTGKDGWLESWEVAGLELDADLVVLSACDTARGRLRGGEGVTGLSWSFFLAGASSTLVTQWKVASDSTARFMIAFHRALRAPATNLALHKAQAVREAQLQCIRDERMSHPFHWAPFVLLGDPSVRAEQ